MAKTMPGTMAGEVSGSVGSTVFGRGRYGGVARLRVKPREVVTVNTVRAQGVLAAQSRAWGALTHEQKQAWEVYSRAHPVQDVLGQCMVVGGKGTFCELNSRLVVCGLASIVLPPVGGAPSALITFGVSFSGTPRGAIFSVQYANLEAGDYLWLYASIRSGRKQRRWQDGLKVVWREVAVNPTFAVVTDAIEDRFGSLIPGQDAHFVARVMGHETGLMGESVVCDTVV